MISFCVIKLVKEIDREEGRDQRHKVSFLCWVMRNLEDGGGKSYGLMAISFSIERWRSFHVFGYSRAKNGISTLWIR